MSTTIPQQSGHGPFGTEREAHHAALLIGGPARPGWSILSPEQNARMLTSACQAAGVDLGDWDERILTWLAGFEDSSCAIIAGLITRAYRAGSARPACQRCGKPAPAGNDWCEACENADAADALAALRSAS